VKRRLFNLLAVASLVLCAATVVLWARSYWVVDILSRSAVKSDQVAVGTYLWSQQGSCGLNRGTATDDQGAIARQLPGHGWQWGTTSTEYTIKTWYGFRFQRLDDRNGTVAFRSTIVCVPHWLLNFIFAVCPSWWLLGERRRRAALRAVGWCKKCGYDLRATPERCPECGTIP
jgi:hypothetical protein